MQIASELNPLPPITLTILLAGNHRYSFRFKSDSLMLRSFLETLHYRYNAPESSPEKFLQITTDENQANLSFAMQNLVGFTLEPIPDWFVFHPEILSENFKNSPQTHVTIFLTSGHQYDTFLPSNWPQLQQLVKTVTTGIPSEPNFSHWFQIPLNQGASLLCFPPENVMACLSEPPVLITKIETAKALQQTQFLHPDSIHSLLEFVAQYESYFTPTIVYRGTEQVITHSRRSRRLSLPSKALEAFEQAIQAILPDVLQKLRIPPFAISHLETEFTAHNDGDYFKLHNDNGGPAPFNTRELSYVYYFHREPKPFSGGELRLYDTEIGGDYQRWASSFKTIEPLNNSVVFFLSRCYHEVRPIRCPSQDFLGSRFTINGWVHRKID